MTQRIQWLFFCSYTINTEFRKMLVDFSLSIKQYNHHGHGLAETSENKTTKAALMRTNITGSHDLPPSPSSSLFSIIIPTPGLRVLHLFAQNRGVSCSPSTNKYKEPPHTSGCICCRTPVAQ